VITAPQREAVGAEELVRYRTPVHPDAREVEPSVYRTTSGEESGV